MSLSTSRVIDDELWELAQGRLAASRLRSGAENPDRSRFWEKRSAQTLLTGKVFCAECGATLAAVGKDYLACNAARKQGTCGNGAGIRRHVLEELVLDALRSRLMAPDQVAAFVREVTAELNRASAERERGKASLSRELAAVNRKLDNLIEAIATRGLHGERLQEQMDALEARRTELKAELEVVPSPPPVMLHPNLAEAYRVRVAALEEGLKDPANGRAALEAARSAARQSA